MLRQPIDAQGRLPVHEIFASFQGEGHHSGRPAVFVRLQGCNVGCVWCDTKHTWAQPGGPGAREVQSLRVVKDGRLPAPEYALLSPEQITDFVRQVSPPHPGVGESLVVITGGEPAQYDLTDITLRILGMGMRPQVETSGSLPIRVARDTWVTLSPKFGFAPPLPEVALCCDEIKMPIGKEKDFDPLDKFMSQLYNPEWASMEMVRLYFQPLSESPAATKACLRLAREHRGRVSVQTHKMAGVR